MAGGEIFNHGLRGWARVGRGNFGQDLQDEQERRGRVRARWPTGGEAAIGWGFSGVALSRVG